MFLINWPRAPKWVLHVIFVKIFLMNLKIILDDDLEGWYEHHKKTFQNFLRGKAGKWNVLYMWHILNDISTIKCHNIIYLSLSSIPLFWRIFTNNICYFKKIFLNKHIFNEKRFYILLVNCLFLMFI